MPKLESLALDQLQKVIERTEFKHAHLDLDRFNAMRSKALHNKSDPALLPIGNVTDASLSIKVRDGDLKAFAEVIPAAGGAPLNRIEVMKSIAQHGIKYGVSLSRIEQLLQLSKTAKTPFEVLIAQGKPAQPGRDAELRRMVTTFRDRMLIPKEDSHGSVDPRDYGAVFSVAPNTPMMERVPPVPAVPGRSVYGTELTVAQPKDKQLVPGDGCDFAENNPNLLEAKRRGLPVMTGTGMQVDDILQLNEVSVKTGHIDFEGSVMVLGDVHDGMKIRASGDIIVAGSVDAAYLEAQGSVCIEQGVFGPQVQLSERHNQVDYKSRIKAGQNVVIDRVQSTAITAGKEVHLLTQATHCDITANGDITIGQGNKPSGKLIGGVMRLGQKLCVGEIGTPAAAKTEIVLGNGRREHSEQLQAARQDHEQQKQTVQELRQEIQHIREMPSTPELQAQLQMCESFLAEAKVSLEQSKSAFEEQNKQVFEYMAHLGIHIYGKLHSGVQFFVCDDKASLDTHRRYGPSKIEFSNNKLEISPLV